MKKKLIIGGSIAIIIIGGYFAWQGIFNKKPSYTFVEAARGDVEEKVSVTGTVISDKQIDLEFENSGKIKKIEALVGGVGIMNIMLVSVIERTREIGLRKAVGANSESILYQFLTESLVITVLGGTIGIILGVANSLAVGLIARTQGLNWPLTISWLAVLAAFFVAMAIGLAFGIYPARKAARLNPIEALRRE